MGSCIDQGFAPEDKPETPHREEKDLRGIIALVHPLVRSWGKVANMDIGQEILLPAETCQWSEHDDLANLCEVFRILLDDVGTMILSTLATYVSSFDAEQTLSDFYDGFNYLAARMINAHFTSVIDAFRIGFTQELDDEPF